MKKNWFTLLETVIVLIIVGILLAITFSLSFDYVNTMKVKTDKEQMANIITDAMAAARTSNYYDSKLYETMEISIVQDRVYSSVVWGSFVLPETVSNFAPNHSQLVFATWISIVQLDIIPYEIGCVGLLNGLTTSWSVSFELHSLINSDTYCYELQQDVCKLNQIVCPE